MTSSASASIAFGPATLEALFGRVAQAVRASGVFGEVSIVAAGTPGPGPAVQGEATGGAGGGIAGLPMLRCEAKASAEPAFYAIRADHCDTRQPAGNMPGVCLWVSLQTGARYLSQSIEADLMFTGDKIDDLVHEEMTDLGYDGPALPFEHFRSEDKLYTFRSPLSITPAELTTDGGLLASSKLCERALLGYEAAFVGLGDMEDAED
jgi:hypothetical protein